MTEREALKLALGALKKAKQHIWLGDEKGIAANIQCTQTITVVEKVLAQPEQDSVAMADYMALVEKYAFLKAAQLEQEPVPRVVLREGSPTLLSDKAILSTDQRLYTHADPDALHAAYMSGFYDGKKAERRERSDRWVGLTDEEIKYIEEDFSNEFGLEAKHSVDFAQAIEAKLKEKNSL